MASIMLVSSTSYCFANTNDVTTNKIIFARSIKVDGMSDKEIASTVESIESKGYKEELMNNKEDKVFNSIVENSIESTSDLDLNTENIEAVKMLLRDDTEVVNEGNDSFVMYAARSARKPKIRIKTSHAAAAFNAIISVAVAAATGAAGTAGINLLIKKLGKTGAKNFLKKKVANKIRNKLIAWGMSKYTKVADAVVFGLVYNLLDPGTALANELDKRDNWGRNGYIEI